MPSQAVQTGQDGQFVFVVKAGSTVEQRPVTVAQRIGDDIVIDKGLRPGETMVTEGQLRLEPGTRVQAGDSAERPTAAGAAAADVAAAAGVDKGDRAARAGKAGRARAVRAAAANRRARL